MEHTVSVLTLIGTALLAGYLGYRIKREREKIRATIAVLGERDVLLIDSLEAMVRRRELVPVMAN